MGISVATKEEELDIGAYYIVHFKAFLINAMRTRFPT